jgi:predicted Zn-dependent protease
MRWRKLSAILVFPLLLALVGCDLDREVEKLLGAIAQTFWELGFERSEDPLLAELTETTGRKVAEVSPRKDMPIKFRVLNTGEVNAVALPNGRIYVFRGMLETSDTEDELAAVLAHEVGHVAGRHSLKQFRLSLGISLLADLLNLNKRGETVQTLAGLAASLYELGYSRQHERDADNYALRLALLAGYDPKGSVALFEKFAKNEGKPARWLIYLLTHPPSTERLERAKRANEDLGRIYPDLPAFAAHAMVAAGYAERGLYRHAALHYEAAIKSQPSYLPALLGLAQAREELQEWDEAKKWYERVLEIEPQNEAARQGLERVKSASRNSAPSTSHSAPKQTLALNWLERTLAEWEQVENQWAERQQTAFNATGNAAVQVKALWSQMRSIPLRSGPISITFSQSERRDRRDNDDAFSWRDAMRLDNLMRTRDEVAEDCARTLAAFQIAMAEVESVFEDARYATGLWLRALKDWQKLVAQGHNLPKSIVEASDESSRILFRIALAFEREATAVRDIERQITRAVFALAEAANLLQRQRSSFVWVAETKLQLARSALQSAAADLHSLLSRTKEKRAQVDKALLSAYQTRLSALEMKTPLPSEGKAPAPVVRKVVAYHLRVSEDKVVAVREKTPDIGATVLIIAFAKAKRVEPEKLLANVDFGSDWLSKLIGDRAPSGVRVALRWLANAWERDWELAEKREGQQSAQPNGGDAAKDDER